jgi:hypothetical protein
MLILKSNGVIKKYKEKKIRKIEFVAGPEAAGFYLKMGAEVVGKWNLKLIQIER